MPDDDVLEEGGLEPAENEPAAGVDEGAVAEEQAPETYTREQLAELLGPRFERFASHEGEEAFRQFGSAYDQATSLIGKGAHLEPQDQTVYEALGIDPPTFQQPEEEPASPLFGVPWAEVSTADELNALAQSEHAEHRKRAAEIVINDPTAPVEYRRAYYDNWAGQGAYDQAVWQEQQRQSEQERIKEELRVEFQQQYAPLQQQYEATMNSALEARANAEIPGFADHYQQAYALMMQHAEFNQGYAEAFVNASLDQRLGQLKLFVNAAAAENAPARKAASQAASDATDAAKSRAQTESRSGNATNNDPSSVSALKQKSLDEMRRVGHLVN